MQKYNYDSNAKNPEHLEQISGKPINIKMFNIKIRSKNQLIIVTFEQFK